MNYIALIPSFEPDDKLIKLVKELKNNNFINVLVNDGSDEKYNNIFDECKKYAKVINYDENQGKGHALKTGVLACKNDIIARMDSDDISRPERCEKELAVLNSDSGISIVGALIDEFTDTPDVVNARRVVPETHEEILQFAKKRNPFNHPSVMYRKAAVLEAGNYSEVRFMQDYYLWVDMLIKGQKGYNIQEPLVWMRAGSNLFKRRSGNQILYIRNHSCSFHFLKQI